MIVLFINVNGWKNQRNGCGMELGFNRYNEGIIKIIFIKMKIICIFLLCISLLVGIVVVQESSLVLSNGFGFVDIFYKVGILEVDDIEDFIINCDEVDCIIFVEYVLVMVFCLQ